jgi:hypothetical protein
MASLNRNSWAQYQYLSWDEYIRRNFIDDWNMNTFSPPMHSLHVNSNDNVFVPELRNDVPVSDQTEYDSHYKYELKRLIRAIEKADITVGCRKDLFDIAFERAKQEANRPLNKTDEVF